MAATSHPLATLAALDILRDGGTAMDAAIAACAVQCVVEPQSTGIGGDCFALYAPQGSADIVAFNGSGRVPAALTAQSLLDQGITSIERGRPEATTIPGAVDAWCQLNARYGKLPLSELLAPAIAYAREGYPVHSRVRHDWSRQVDWLKQDANAAAVFLPNGEVPAVGAVHHQTALADTLEKIAKEGRDGFYKGAVAEDMVSYLQSLGGVHTLEDFAEAAGEFVTPISSNYRGYDVYECPPNGQGIAALGLLNMMENFDFSGMDPLSAERLHLEIEATRIAYRDRDEQLADPAQADIPVGAWLDKDRAAKLAAGIDPDKRSEELPPSEFPKHKDTVYITVVDKDRNAVSFINSIFNSFGSVRLAPKSGVMLHNRGCSFRVEPGHPNCIAPGKRPMHTIIPGMLVKDGKAVMPFGVMGGHYQACGQARLLSNIIDFGLDVQEAIDLPRLFPEDDDGRIDVESGIGEAVRAELRAKGHVLKDSIPAPIGGAQAIQIDWEEGVLTGGSDPRKDGAALGY
ncbi:gamma-glutamyltransferase [Rhodovibrionaceae bacterium A322]